MRTICEFKLFMYVEHGVALNATSLRSSCWLGALQFTHVVLVSWDHIVKGQDNDLCEMVNAYALVATCVGTIKKSVLVK